MWTAALRIKAWGGFPVYPCDVMLLSGKQKSFAERFVPGPQDLPGNPRVGKLADGKDAGRLIAKQHGKARLETIRPAGQSGALEISTQAGASSTPIPWAITGLGTAGSSEAEPTCR